MSRDARTATGTRRGRRVKGTGDPREDILRAALREFVRHGYDGATIRSIAREARVDPALVYHYFRSKEALFLEPIRSRMRRPTPDEMPSPASAGEAARQVARLFLQRWGGDGPTPFLALLRSASSNPKAAALLRRVIAEEITPYVASRLPGGDADRRVALVASTLLGMGVVRYIVRLEPLASASPDDLARWMAPALEGYLRPDLG